MCVDFTDINKAVDATSGHELLMDTYSGYNQIKMKPEDRERHNSG